MTFLLTQLSAAQTVPSATKSLEQETDLPSKARNVEVISSDEQAKTHQMAAKTIPVLPDSIFVQSIFPNLRLHEVRDIRQVSKTVKSQAVRSLRFRKEVSWQEIKEFLKAGGDVKTLNVKIIKGQGENVTDEDVEKISHLPHLEEIYINGAENCYISDEALIALGAHAAELKRCEITCTNVTSVGIKALAIGCKKLSEINLEYSFSLDDEALIALGEHASELTSCNLSSTRITHEGIKALSIGCKKLSEINLKNCRNIDDRALIALGAYAHELTKCLIRNYWEQEILFTHVGIEALAIGCRKLSEIDLSENKNTDDNFLKALGEHASALTSCNISGHSSGSKVTNAGVEALAKGCEKLTRLNLHYCKNIDDGALRALGTHARELRSCNLCSTQVTHAGIKALAMGCEKLSEILLQYCRKIDDRALKALGDHASELTHCDVSYVTGITYKGVEDLAIGCKKLSEINLQCCSIYDDALKALEVSAANLTRCNVRYTRVTSKGIQAFAKGKKNCSLIWRDE